MSDLSLLTVRSKQKYGWVKDLPDRHDAVLGVAPPSPNRPAQVLLSDSPHMPPIYSQLDLGACTAHGCKRVIEFDNHFQTGTFYDPSRLFIYGLERYVEGTFDSDSGAQVRDGIKVTNKIGNIPESEWPYITSTFADPPQPLHVLAEGAKVDRVKKYARVPQTADSVMGVLAGPNNDDGRPFVFGFTVYESFEDAIGADGVMPLPQPGEEVLGGHCVAGTGYIYINGVLYVQCANSWDTTWGDNGYFYMPMSYLLSSQASDLWVVYSTNDAVAAAP